MSEEEIAEMNKSLEYGEEAAATAAPGTAAPATEAPVEPGTDAPATTAPATTAPATTAPATEPPSQDDDVKTIAELKAEIELLRAEKEKSPLTSAPATAAPESKVPLNFVTEEEFDDVRDDPQKFNALLAKVYERATADVVKKFDERFSKVPETVSEQIRTQEELSRIRTSFYAANPDLENLQEYVGMVFTQLQKDNPDKPWKDLLEQTGPEVRKRLGLKNESQKNPQEKQTPPRLPSRKGQAGKTPSNKTTNSLVSEIDEMNKSLEN